MARQGLRPAALRLPRPVGEAGQGWLTPTLLSQQLSCSVPVGIAVLFVCLKTGCVSV